MGHLLLFNVMDPDGPYRSSALPCTPPRQHLLTLRGRLFFSSREDTIVAKILIELAIREDGENVFEERFAPDPSEEGELYTTPKSWLQTLPRVPLPLPYAEA